MFKTPNFYLPPPSWRTKLWHSCWLLLLISTMVACWSGQWQYDAWVLACGLLVLALEFRKYQQKQILNIVKIQAPPISSSSTTSEPQWLLTDGYGAEHHAKLDHATRATSWLVYLCFHINYGVTRKKYQTAIWRGDIMTSQWRELVTYLRLTASIDEVF